MVFVLASGLSALRACRVSRETDKQRLIDACLQSGASLSGLALQGDANQLRKWVRLREQSNAPGGGVVSIASSAFVPVVAIDDPASVLAPAPTSRPVPEPEP